MRTYRPPSIGPGDQEDQVNRELAGSALLRTAKSVVAGTSRQGRAGFHGWSSPRNCTLIPRTPRSTLGSYPDLPTAAPDHSLLRLPWSALYASSHVSIRRPHLPVSSLLKAQGSGCLACPRLFCCLSLQPIVSCHPAPYSLFSLHTHSAFPPIITSSYSLLLPFRPPPETLPPLVFLSPSRRRIIQPIHSFVQAARMVSVFITWRPRNVV